MTTPTPTDLPEALRLAHLFDQPLPPEWSDMVAAAAELRRLHALTVPAEAADKESLTAAQPLAGAPAGTQLFKFYGVTNDAELIAAQAAHIERLQAKLPQAPSFAPQRVREG